MIDHNQDDYREGDRRRDDAHAVLKERRAVYLLRGQRALLTVLFDAPTATIDDVRERVTLPAKINPKVFGPVPVALANAGIIHAVGTAKTRRPEGHARPVTVWAMADSMLANHWMADHPEMPDPADGKGPPVQRDLFPIDPRNEPGATAGTVTPGDGT